MLVTTGQLIPTLGKLLLFQLNQAFGATGKPLDTIAVCCWVCKATLCAAGASREGLCPGSACLHLSC